jgi:hypothetical protein
MIKTIWSKYFLAVVLFLSMAAAVQAEEKLKPFVLASNQPGDVEAAINQTRSALTGGGFEVVGEYSPYDGAHVIVVTNDTLKTHAAESEMGGYGAIQRVSITKVKDNVQVAYTNPVYMSHAYRMNSDLSDVAGQLKSALGAMQTFGTKGLTAKKLRKYHYTFGMEYFDEPSVLGEFASHEEAIQKVESGLSQYTAGVSKVYRVDIPGKQESVFGVAMNRECSGDKYIMDRIDGADLRGTAHLPYEMLVSGNKVYALYARFRIAQSFPDLSMMMGSYTFMKIMCAPESIENALSEVVGNKKETEE